MGSIDSTTDISLTNATSYANYLTNWSDQLRQIVCSNVSTACLSVNSGGVANCRGALVFSGRTSTGLPRTSLQKTLSLANLSNYYESGLALLTTGGTFSGNSVFSNTSPTADVAACLGYGSFGSLKQDAAAFSSGIVAPAGAGNSIATVTGIGGATPTIVLGAAGTANRSGCVLLPTTQPLTSSLRLYFTYNIASATTGASPRGFTLALADGATNNVTSTDPVMCGASGSTRLGYAGSVVSGTATVSGITAANITGLTWASGASNNVTVTTAANHLFTNGQSVTIAGASPDGYNGTFTVANKTSTTFKYTLATNPGAVYMGIFPPKIGFEFDTYYDSSRGDTTSGGLAADNHHFAFVYWGLGADNNPAAATRNGNDDNTHNIGVLGDGAQPFNPRDLSTVSALATPVTTISAANWSGGTATITTAALHGFSNGQSVVVSDVSPLGYKGTYTATVTDATHLTYAQATNPGSYPYVATLDTFAISSASWSGGTATFTTLTSHGLTSGQSVTLSDITPVAWNGTYTVTVTDAKHFTVTIPSDPGTITSLTSAASWSSGTATFRTTTAHGLSSGQTVTLSNISPTAWNGNYVITVTDSTHFTAVLASNPGAYSSGGHVSSPLSFVSSASWSNNKVTVTTSAAHNLVSDQFVTISGASPSAYNGTNRITVIDSTHFRYFRSTTPGTYGSGGTIAIAGGTSTVMASPISNSTINAVSWASSSATVTTAAAHGLTAGQSVHISGAYPAGYNGRYVVSVVDSTHFTYSLATDPGGSFVAGTYSNPGISTVKSSDVFLPYSKTPYDTTIHVRLDITRSYDALKHTATLTFKGYVGDTFDISGNCVLADFKNFSRDLSELCPVRTPTIEQDGILFNDAAGPALESVYLGFTTARGTSSGDNETINIQNLIFRTQ